MDSNNIILMLNEDYLTSETIWLECAGYDAADREDFEPYAEPGNYPGLMISIEKGTGKPLLAVVEGFRTETEPVIKSLRDNPLPWVFTLESLGIREKPLEDVLLAVWKKFRGIKMEWE